MSTKTISTRHEQEVCDVCERTLLRGEHPEVFVNGGRRYSVCELCKPRALHAGWMREGAIPDYPDLSVAPDRRRSLFHRRRPARGRRPEGSAREASAAQAPQSPPQTLDDELSLGAWPDGAPALVPPQQSSERRGRRAAREHQGEVRHVHAIPTSVDHKRAAALDVFNRTEHCRTIAGVSRSLGAPSVNVTPDVAHATLVWVVAAWELCWYRYEVDLSDERGSVRVAGQGYELDELEAYARVANARSDENGSLKMI